MDDQIRIAPDRRREVRVAGRREAEVAQVFRRVARLLHRPQHQHRDRLFFGLSVDLLEQLLEMARPQRVGRSGQAVAEPRNEFLELRDLEDVGLFVDAVERRRLLRLEERRHGLVGEEHELLDQAGGRRCAAAR